MNLNKKINFNWTKKKTMMLFSVLIFVIIGIFIYSFFFQNNFSKENIIINISGSEEMVSGKETSWVVSIENKSELSIKDATLTITYPDGVFDSKGLLKKREKIKIKSLSPGEKKVETFSGKIFGQEDEVKEIKALFVYSPEGISTKFENKSSFLSRVSGSSLVFLVEIPSKLNPGEEFSIFFNWQSSFDFVLENSQIRFSFPENFKRISQDGDEIEEESGKIIFDIGSLNEGEGGKKEIKGILNGEVGDEKMFKAEFGIFDEKLYEFIPLVDFEKTIKIVSSSLDLFSKINGQADFIASPGDTLSYIIDFVNTGEDIYRDLDLIVELESDVLDFNSLSAPGGKVNGKKIIFEAENFPYLLYLGPYGKGSVGFEVKVKEYSPSFYKEKGTIKEKITFSAIEKEFETKVSSNISFIGNIYYNLPNNFKGELETSGTFPFKKEESAKLVLMWEIKNEGNKLEDVIIEANLAEGVNFENKVFPNETKFSFDKETRKLIFQLGDLSSFVSSKIFATEVEITPDLLPEIILNDVKLKGKDAWTDKEFEKSLLERTTDSVL